MLSFAVPLLLLLLRLGPCLADIDLLRQFNDEQVIGPELQRHTLGLQGLRNELVAANYTVRGLADLMEVSPSLVMNVARFYAEQMSEAVTRVVAKSLSEETKPAAKLAWLVRIFWFSERLPVKALQEVMPGLGLSETTLEVLNALSLWRFIDAPEDGEGKEAYFPLQLWPAMDDLIIATDSFFVGGIESRASWETDKPWHAVMYLGVDSFALVATAPAATAAVAAVDSQDRGVDPDPLQLLDVCAGSGIQGIAQLRKCGQTRGLKCRPTFVDVNPRAVRFTRFNLAANAAVLRASAGIPTTEVAIGAWLGAAVLETAATDLSLEAIHRHRLRFLPQQITREDGGYIGDDLGDGFDRIVANPPYLPDPQGTAHLYGGGGALGSSVLLSIVERAPALLAPSSTAAAFFVGNVANTGTIAERTRLAWRRGGGGPMGCWHFRGPTLSVEAYAAVQEAESATVQSGGTEGRAAVLRAAGVDDVSPHSFLVVRRNLTAAMAAAAAPAAATAARPELNWWFQFWEHRFEGPLWDMGISGDADVLSVMEKTMDTEQRWVQG